MSFAVCSHPIVLRLFEYTEDTLTKHILDLRFNKLSIGLYSKFLLIERVLVLVFILIND